MYKSYEQYRQEIYYLDEAIANTKDVDKKLELIDRNINLNNEYIHLLKKSLPVRIIFCVILSFVFLLGLDIFLPQIIVRNNKIKACERRITYLITTKKELSFSEKP